MVIESAKVDVVPWRGGRDDREWPRRLTASPRWPFQEDYYDGMTEESA